MKNIFDEKDNRLCFVRYLRLFHRYIISFNDCNCFTINTCCINIINSNFNNWNIVPNDRGIMEMIEE